jgi:hypothetical protein
MAVALQINQLIWVEVVGVAEGSGAHGSVALITADRVGVRFDGASAPAGLLPECNVLLRLVNEHGVHTGRASVAQVTRKPLAAMLRTPITFSTTQNRKFVRVPAKMQATCSVRASRHPALVGQRDDAAKTQDLSAGGARITTSLPLSMGDEIDLAVKLRNVRWNEPELKISGRVVRAVPFEKKPRMTFQVGVEFVHANQRQLDALVLLVFELQRKSLA